MKRIIHTLVRLYPPKWRKRYENEFRALLDDIRPQWRDVLDLLKGGLEMRLLESAWPKYTAIFGIAGALVCGVVALRIPNQYASTAVLAGAPPQRLLPVIQAALSRPVLWGIIE